MTRTIERARIAIEVCRSLISRCQNCLPILDSEYPETRRPANWGKWPDLICLVDGNRLGTVRFVDFAAVNHAASNLARGCFEFKSTELHIARLPGTNGKS